MLFIDRSLLKNCLFLNARYQKSSVSTESLVLYQHLAPYHYGVTGQELLRFRYLNHRVHVWTNILEQ